MSVGSDLEFETAAADALATGDWREAHQHLEQVPPERRPHPDVLLLRCRTAAQAGRWADVERIASAAIVAFPDAPDFHTQKAWAIHRQERTLEALQALIDVEDRFPRSVAVAYSLASLNGALGRLTAARQWLQLAIERARNPDKVKLRSLTQPELQCLWGA